MTRRLLLSTALDLFNSKGYAATTVDEIAAAAGTTRVTFYAYFPSRADLMKTLFGELNELLGRTESPSGRTTGGTLVDVVAEGDPANIGTWIRDTAGNWDQIRPYTKVAFEAAAVDSDIRALLDDWLDEAVGDIEEGLEAAGRFAPGSRRVRGVLAITQLDHVARNWTPGRWGADEAQLLDVLTAAWAGLLC